MGCKIDLAIAWEGGHSCISCVKNVAGMSEEALSWMKWDGHNDSTHLNPVRYMASCFVHSPFIGPQQLVGMAWIWSPLCDGKQADHATYHC